MSGSLDEYRDNRNFDQTIPSLGETLPRRIAETLDIRTLEELEQAAHDGSFDKVAGFGAERVRAVQTALAGMLSSTAQRRARQRTSDIPRYTRWDTNHAPFR